MPNVIRLFFSVLLILCINSSVTKIQAQEVNWVNEYNLPYNSGINSLGFIYNDVYFGLKTEYFGGADNKRIAFQHLIAISLKTQQSLPSILLSSHLSKELYLNSSKIIHIDCVDGNIYVFYKHTNPLKDESKILLKIFNLKGESTSFKELGNYYGSGYKFHSMRIKFDSKSSQFIFLERKQENRGTISELNLGILNLQGQLEHFQKLNIARNGKLLSLVQDFVYENDNNSLTIIGRYFEPKVKMSNITMMFCKIGDNNFEFYDVETQEKFRTTSFEYHYDEKNYNLYYLAVENSIYDQNLILNHLNLKSGTLGTTFRADPTNEFAFNSFALGPNITMPIPNNLNVVSLFKDDSHLYAVCEEDFNKTKISHFIDGDRLSDIYYQHFGGVWFFKFSKYGNHVWTSYLPKNQRAYSHFNQEMGIKTIETENHIWVLYNDLYWNESIYEYKRLSQYRGDSQESQTVLAKISKESGDIQKQGLFKHKGLHREESWKSIVSMFLVRKIDNDKVLLTARHPKGHLKFGILELNPKIKTN